MDVMNTELQEPALDFEDFYRLHRDRIFRTVFATVGNFHDAEDATAEAFFRANTQWDSLHTHPSPAAWVVMTAKNIYIDTHRRVKRFDKLKNTLVQPSVTMPEVEGFDEELHMAINRLPQRQREVLALRVILELPAQEVSAVLGISIGAVGTHLHRALTGLRKTYSRQGSGHAHG